MATPEKSNTTIMFTDIVGYSAMINKDQNHALNLLATHDKIIEPIIEDFNGSIIKKIGDAIFAEFPQSENSVQSAIKIQEKLNSRNLISKPIDKITIRIGLHTGEVIRRDKDLFGHAVNLCSRIESTALSGCIAISKSLMETLSENHYKIREMGYIKLKNITHPQQIFKVYLGNDDYENESAKHLKQNLIENGITVVNMDSYNIEDVYSTAILYVKNIGADESESISFNLTESLIQDLGYINQLRTPGFNEILQFKDSEMGRDDIGRQLKVDNVLQGNILKEGDSLKLNFELLNINEGTIIWKDTWTELLSNNKKIRQRIIQSILSKLDLEMPEQLIKSYSEELTENKEALEVFYKGKYCSDILKSDKDLEDAKNYLDSAITLDNTFVTAYAEYALACQRLGFFDEAESSLNKGEKYAEKSNDNQGLSGIYNGFYTLYSSWGKYAKAHDFIKKALTIQITLQNNLMETRLRLNYANLLNHLGEPALSLEQNSQANRILVELEEDRLLGISHAVMTNTYFVLGDYSESVKNGILSLGLFRKIEMSSYEGKILVVIADALSKMGDFDKMDSYIKKAEPIVTIFHDTLLMAKIELLKSQSALNKGNIQSAIEFNENSIDTAELAEHRNFLTKALLDQIKLYIEDGKLDKAGKLISKMEVQLKKISDSANQPLLLSMKYFLNAEKDTSITNQLDSIIETIEKTDNLGNEFVYWYLARAYRKIDDKGNAELFHNKAKEMIDSLAKNISNKDDRKYYHDIYFHKRIMEELEDGKTKTEEKPETPSVFGFCPGCGFKNENSFAFCPSCGNDLKQ